MTANTARSRNARKTNSSSVQRSQQQIAAESKRVDYGPAAVVQVVQAFERGAQAMRCDDSNKDEDRQ